MPISTKIPSTTPAQNHGPPSNDPDSTHTDAAQTDASGTNSSGTIPPAAITPGANSPGARARDPHFDNIKFVLITLVVIGHSISGIVGTFGPAGDIYRWIYTFHMPAFVVAAGYFSRTFRFDRRRSGALIDALLIPYLIFEAIHRLESTFMQGELATTSPLSPTWGLWFPLALLGWRLLTPWLQHFRPAATLTLAVAASLLAGLNSGLTGDLSAGRLLAMLPFFVIGLAMRPEHFVWLRNTRIRISAAVYLALLAVSVTVFKPFPRGMLYWSHGYHHEDLSNTTGVVMRLALLLVAAGAAFSVFSLVPDRRLWWTNLGAASIYVYLIHVGLLYIPNSQGWFSDYSTPWGLASLIAGAVLLTLVLSSPPVQRAARPLVQPALSRFLLKRETAPADPSSSTGTDDAVRVMS